LDEVKSLLEYKSVTMYESVSAAKGEEALLRNLDKTNIICIVNDTSLISLSISLQIESERKEKVR
jgi:hypothetical protein